MPKLIARQVELELSLDQILVLVRQLKPEEQELVRGVIEPPPWSQRVDALLTRVWDRVEQSPLTEEEIDVEVERARTTISTQGSG